jgi:hypothetical protein
LKTQRVLGPFRFLLIAVSGISSPRTLLRTWQKWKTRPPPAGFRCASNVIAADPKHIGAEIGFLSVLHTWGQTLQPHPHVHCVVPGGGLSPDHQQWIRAPNHFFLPVGC